jgi:prepilin-type N-terminal cleavage/methylation domain-containing protein
MILNKSKSNRKDRGFTIVELLVVIVVIGILAAITIVAYTGFTARAKTSQSQSNANSAMQVVAAYTADATANFGGNGTYPANVAAMGSYTLTKMPAGVTLVDQTATHPSSGDSLGQVTWKQASATGGCIGYYDTAGSTAAYYYVGTATGDVTSSATCS